MKAIITALEKIVKSHRRKCDKPDVSDVSRGLLATWRSGLDDERDRSANGNQSEYREDFLRLIMVKLKVKTRSEMMAKS
jgi:hypothetical protein